MHRLLQKLPNKQQIIPVFSTIVFVSFTWMLFTFYWKLPSWLQYLTVGEILVILAYALVGCLFESLAILSCLVVLSLILPKKYFRDKFVAQGSTLVLFAGIWACVYLLNVNKIGEWVPLLFGIWIGIIVIMWTLLSLSVYGIKLIEKVFAWVADRFILFLYLYGGLGVISFLILCIRYLILVL